MNGIDSAIDSKKQCEIRFIHVVENGQHVFVIADTGVGIEEKNLTHIFTPGFSTKINYATGEINRGLGLSVVKDIVENHLGGKVTVSSEEDKGTTFRICIPRDSLEV